jgi:plastocyanin
MTRIHLALVAVLVAGLVATASALAATPKLTGVVGPHDAFTISLTKAGKKVTKLKAGKYTLVVKDDSRIHNYRLKGPGLNKQVTTVTFVGTKTVTVTLKPGKYTFDCDPHFAAMHSSFTVTR